MAASLLLMFSLFMAPFPLQGAWPAASGHRFAGATHAARNPAPPSPGLSASLSREREREIRCARCRSHLRRPIGFSLPFTGERPTHLRLPICFSLPFTGERPRERGNGVASIGNIKSRTIDRSVRTTPLDTRMTQRSSTPPQTFCTYSRIVRSVENRPMPAMLRNACAAQASGVANKVSTFNCVAT